MKTNKELLKVAIAQLGNGGSKYQKYTGLTSKQPWCDAWTFWLFDANGCGSLLKWTGNERTSAPYSIKWCEKNLAQIPPYLAMACDIVYYDWEPNGRPNHVGIVENHWGVNSIHAIEGNTSNGKKSSVVARKDRKGYIQAVFRPHFEPATMPKKEKLAVDGDCGYKTIYMLQVALGCGADAVLGKNTVKALQKKAGASQDGAWGKGTTKAVQKMIGTSVDGQWGKGSTKALQRWINKKVFPSTSTTTKPKTSTSKPATSKPVQTSNAAAQAIIAQLDYLAWPYGTSKTKYSYKKGSPTSNCKKAMNAQGYKGKGKQSSCIYFANTAVRRSGVNKKFCAGHGYKKPYPKTEAGFDTVLSGKSIPNNFLQPGDLIRYKKKGKDEHAMFYYGNGKICDAGHYNRFGNIRKDDKRYNKSNVKKSTLQVLRPRG